MNKVQKFNLLVRFKLSLTYIYIFFWEIKMEERWYKSRTKQMNKTDFLRDEEKREKAKRRGG